VKVSVIIPVHNQPELTQRCLYKWLRQAYPAEEYELIVVDDDSKGYGWVMALIDLEMARVRDEKIQHPPEVRYLRLESEYIMRSPNTAYLAGVEAATGDYLILSSQDVLVPALAIQGLLNTHQRYPDRRASVVVYWLSEGMQSHLDEYNWRENLNQVTTMPGFWADGTSYGRPNSALADGGLFILCSGMSREYWEWIGGLRRTFYHGMDDRDLVEREQFLQRYPITVPGLFCIHQWHSKNLDLRRLMVHPGFRYQNERQARLLEPAPINSIPESLEVLRKDRQPSATLGTPSPEPQPGQGKYSGVAPGHVTELIRYVLGVIGQLGVHSLWLSSEWWAAEFTRQARAQGYEVHPGPVDMVVSLMQLQTHATFEAATHAREQLSTQGKRMLVLVPYREHFTGGDNVLQFDEASLQATWSDTTMTGYMVGVF